MRKHGPGNSARLPRDSIRRHVVRASIELAGRHRSNSKGTGFSTRMVIKLLLSEFQSPLKNHPISFIQVLGSDLFWGLSELNADKGGGKAAQVQSPRSHLPEGFSGLCGHKLLHNLLREERQEQRGRRFFEWLVG